MKFEALKRLADEYAHDHGIDSIPHRFLKSGILAMELTRDRIVEARPADALTLASAWVNRIRVQDPAYLTAYTNYAERKWYIDDDETAKMGCMFRPRIEPFDWRIHGPRMERYKIAKYCWKANKIHRKNLQTKARQYQAQGIPVPPSLMALISVANWMYFIKIYLITSYNCK